MVIFTVIMNMLDLDMVEMNRLYLHWSFFGLNSSAHLNNNVFFTLKALLSENFTVRCDVLSCALEL